MKLVTAAQMQELDRSTIAEVGLPGIVLMENAGRSLAEQVAARYAHCRPGPVAVLAGKGNNGGDGFVIARYLRDWGWNVVTLALAAREDYRGDAATTLAALEACHGEIRFVGDVTSLAAGLESLNGVALVIDALFGTGLTKPVGGHYAAAVHWINRAGVPVVAVDIPSGVEASTGRLLGDCVRADLTVTFGMAKLGQVSYPGAGCVGELVVADIGIPACLREQVEPVSVFVDPPAARALLPQRPVDGHKGTFGHLLVLAGSPGKGGAAVMTATAGLRGGAGLVTLATPASLQPVVATQLVEVMTAPLPESSGQVSLLALADLLALCAGKQALALGPGLGLEAGVETLVRQLVRDCALPLVIDADGLTALAGDLDVLGRCSGPPPVLTPHPGEMARLTGLSAAEVQADRAMVASDFARRHRVVLVLKGARTLTALPDGRLLVNASGHAGMASGGMGDVLTGLIGSLLAQGLEPGAAAALGVYLHGAAADRLRGSFGDAGMLATDLMHELPAARQALTRS